jgi:hypothetical protein
MKVPVAVLFCGLVAWIAAPEWTRAAIARLRE